MVTKTTPPEPRKRGRQPPPGVTVRISAKTGKRKYQVRVRRSALGSHSVSRTFATLADAETWLSNSLARVNENSPLATRAHRRTTVERAIDEYVEQGKVLSASEGYVLATLKREFSGFPILELTVAKVEAWKREMLDVDVVPPKNKRQDHPLYDGANVRKRSKGTVRKYFYALKKVLEWHSVFRGYPFNSPFQHVAAPVESGGRTRRIEGDERDRLLAACDKMYSNVAELKSVITVALETAMRAGEILKLEWHEVDLPKRQLVIPAEKCKTRRARQVPLTTDCVTALEDLKVAQAKKILDKTRSAAETRVFAEWPNSLALGHRFKVITKNAGIQNMHFHDLRHEATSRFYERTNLRDTEIASITGHSDMRTLRRYANLRASELAQRLW